MAVNRITSATRDDAPEAEDPRDGAEGEEGAAKKKSKGGIKPWLPLILNLTIMPALAFLTVHFLGPKSRHAAHGTPPAASVTENTAEGATSDASGKIKYTAPLSGKVLVNVAGTMGTRYLLANITLVGAKADMKTLVEKNDAQLRDAAASALSSKTIADLEKAGARNVIRAELISVFNSVLGNGAVQDIYLTEFAIQ